MSSNELDVGYVAGAHGVRGAVRIKLHDPTSVALEPETPLVLRREDEDILRCEVVSSEPVPGKPGLFRARLGGVANRSAAEALKGCTIVVTRDALPALEPGEFYLADAVGLRVERDDEPRHLGTIVGLTSNGGQDLFEVEWLAASGKRHRWLLPVLEGIVRDVDAERVHVELPPGFVPEELETP